MKEKEGMEEKVGVIMERYYREVNEDVARLEKNIQETLKYFKISLPQKLQSTTIFHKVGSLDLGTMFALKKDDYRLDIALYNPDQSDILAFRDQVFEGLQSKDAEIRVRGDDLSFKTYLGARYPTIRCADPDHEFDYDMRLIFLKGMGEDYLLQHNGSFKEVIDYDERIKSLFVNVASWAKNFLYDPKIKYDMFSSYELQLLFLHFLSKHSILHHSDSPDYSKQVISPTPNMSAPKLFLDFLNFLAFDLNPTENVLTIPFSDLVHQPEIEEYQNDFSFYQLRDRNSGRYVDFRRTRRDYGDVINMFRTIRHTLETIKAGQDFFD